MKKSITMNQTEMTADIHYLNDELRIRFKTKTKALADLARSLFQKALTDFTVCIAYGGSVLDLPLSGAGFQNEEPVILDVKNHPKNITCTLRFDVPFEAVHKVFTELKNQEVRVDDDNRAKFVDIDVT